jgi:hypothetical protein
VAPGGIVFDSWVHEPLATNLGGEPAMTLLPDLLVAGVLTILASLAVLGWAAAGAGRAGYGPVLLLLSVAMLLVGGGFGPPLLGMLAALAGLAAGRRHDRWAARMSGRFGRVLAGLGPLLFWVVLLDAVLLVVGSVMLTGWFDVNAPQVFVYALFVAVAGLPVATVAGIARDVEPPPATAAAAGGAGPDRPSRREI